MSEKKTDATVTKLFGSRGAYCSTKGFPAKKDHEGKPVPVTIQFGDRVTGTEAAFEKLPQTLKRQLFEESAWAAHCKKQLSNKKPFFSGREHKLAE